MSLALRKAACGWPRVKAMKASVRLTHTWSWGSSLARRSLTVASMVSAELASPRSATSQPR